MRSLWIQRINAGTRQHGVSLFSFFLFIFLPILLAGFSFVIE
jgi:ribosomal protein L20